MKHISLLFIILSAIFFHSNAQYRVQLLDSNTFTLGVGVELNKTSFRGLSVVDDQTVWISGSNGTIARSTNGGKSFSFTQLRGYEKSDFRDIEAFDDKRAIVMSSGTPAYILKTTDGGQTWKEVYKNTDSSYFLDAMDFWNDKNGMLVGDPVNGQFVLLETKDGGNSWKQLDPQFCPGAKKGEAVFAASGTSLRCLDNGHYGFVTGGASSRFFMMKKGKQEYTVHDLKITYGPNSSGAFSFARSNKHHYWFFTGGDYITDTLKSTINFYYSHDLNFDSHYIAKTENPNGYKSCIEVIDDGSDYAAPYIVVTGTSGTQVAARIVSDNMSEFAFYKAGPAFNVVQKAKKGKAIFLSGSRGRIGKLVH